MVHYVKLTQIEKENFSFYGNDCWYYLDVYDSKKHKIGEACVTVVNMGVDYSSAYEFIYDYDLKDEGQRADLAEMLGVDEIKDEWLDENGDIDTSLLPEDVCKSIEDNENEMLMDYYYEDFAEHADKDGFMKLKAFAEMYMVRKNNSDITHINTKLPLDRMFEGSKGIEGWYREDPPEVDISKFPTDISSDEGKELLFKIVTAVANNLENLDFTSGYVNVCFLGDYDREEEAAETMRQNYLAIATNMFESIPCLARINRKEWRDAVSRYIVDFGRKSRFLYPDETGCFDDLADIVYQGLIEGKWPSPEEYKIIKLEDYEKLIR